jgi:tight adherence protein C
VTLFLPLIAFVFGSLLVGAAAYMFAPSGATTIERRLGEVTGTSVKQSVERSNYSQTIVSGLKRLGNLAPKRPSEMGKLQQRLINAGYRSNEALIIFSGIRVMLALAVFMVLTSPLIGRPNFGLALVACAIGYTFPTIALGRMAKRRQHKIQLALPDALDLLVVSVEAGLGLDQAILRVGDELAFAHPELCEELRLVNLELRAGKARPEALHNLAERTGVDDVSSLVAMLVQTDKFGTSVAQSLRVHSESVRTKRRQRAEEAAAKTGAKMVFPLVICIFPAIWVVTIGPAAIKFVQVLVPLAENHK